MKTTVTKWATKAAGAGAIALLLAAPSFAQSRGDYSRNRGSEQTAVRTSKRNGQWNNRGNEQTTVRTSEQNGQWNNRGSEQTTVRTAGQNGQWSNNREANSRAQEGAYRESQRVTETGRVRSFSRERNGYRIELDRGRSFWVPEGRFGNRARDLRAGISITLGGVFRGGSVYVDDVTWPDYGYGYNDGFVSGVVNHVDHRTGTVWIRDNVSGREIAAQVGGSGYSLRPGEYVELTGQWVRGGNFDVARINSIGGRRF